MRLIKHVKASNLLSFGHSGLDLELHDLNVLIGPNGSGKSNFLEIFELLKSLPRNEEGGNDLKQVISNGGGPAEWACKSHTINGRIRNFPIADIEVIIEDKILLKEKFLKHKFSIDWGSIDSFPLIPNEIISMTMPANSTDFFFYEKDRVDAFAGFHIWNDEAKQMLPNTTESFGLSILSKRYANFGILVLGDAYENIRLYREWSFGRNTIFRTPQSADLRNDRLESDFSNLGMFLSRLKNNPVTKRALIAALRDLYEGLTDFEVHTHEGTVQIFFTEGDFSIPATRLSDGTLRYLCLLALLLDPTPPPLICIEEPELGLYPDLLPKIADLLVEASTRTQLIVTTHSDVLIDALSEQPESVLVCEKHEGQTRINRLDRDDIAHWLKDYRLGQLWMRGEIGGTRW